MRYFLRFQINQDKTFQNVIVKYQINIIVFFICMNVLLSGNKSISLTKLHQESLEIADNTLLKVRFMIRDIFLHAQKFRNHRIFDKLKLILIRRSQLMHFFFHTCFILRFQYAIVILR